VVSRLHGIVVLTTVSWLHQIERQIDKYPDAKCSIYLISGGKLRERSLSERDEIPQLFQGSNPSNPKIYAGDGKIRAKSGLTVQIHVLKLLEHGTKKLIVANVPSIAVYVPKDMEANWIVQEK
jgi:hypothetical protein